MKMRLLTVVGARPQFIKAAVVSRTFALHNRTKTRPHIQEILLHTGQHYDDAMSDAFFRELRLPPPAHHLEVGSGNHGAQTGEMLSKIEKVLVSELPDHVLVYGDTNSTLAGALAAAKLSIPISHVEGGMRSFHRDMPEEINRKIADHLSSLLFCSSRGAVANLLAEGITSNVYFTGDVMREALDWQMNRVEPGAVLRDFRLESGEYVLVTVHRSGNVDTPDRLNGILEGLDRIAKSGLKVVFPAHPRTANALEKQTVGTGITIVPPLQQSELLSLVSGARVVLTDSGGLQKEAYWLGTPCITLREETEWPETVEAGWNVLVGVDPAAILEAALFPPQSGARPPLYGDDTASAQIVHRIADFALRGRR